MTHTFRLPSLLAAALSPFLLAGCVSVQKYTYHDAPRAGTGFASGKASQTFYEALLAEKFPADGYKHSLTVFVPLPVSYYERDRDSSTIVVNAALAQADTDKDGVITEQEAEAYAAALAAKREAAKKPGANSTAPMAGVVSDDGIAGAGVMTTDHPKG